jgi:hypothetical protein
MSLSYHPLCLVDVSICAIVVYRLLAQLILPISLRHDSKLVRRPPSVELVPDLLILN